MVHITPPCGHRWHLGTCTAAVPRHASRRKNIIFKFLQSGGETSSASVSVVNRLRIHRDENSLFPMMPTGLLTGYGAGQLRSILPTVSNSGPVISITNNPIRRNRIVSDLQQTPTWCKPTPPGYRNFTLISSILGVTVEQTLKCQWWQCGGLMCGICHPYVR